ncbi:hypothetical protein B0H17DRAFT_1123597 [Mycena rosella]|uniref:Uncharacterized protein n=1 Tax=Mycena rosella TaxID=1033263 RepID=A0AAD7MC81_MYCRO|nr:hypothetical protein B0H17DRAFT_1123597 [Mycena rosella]
MIFKSKVDLSWLACIFSEDIWCEGQSDSAASKRKLEQGAVTSKRATMPRGKREHDTNFRLRNVPRAPEHVPHRTSTSSASLSSLASLSASSTPSSISASASVSLPAASSINTASDRLASDARYIFQPYACSFTVAPVPTSGDSSTPSAPEGEADPGTPGTDGAGGNHALRHGVPVFRFNQDQTASISEGGKGRPLNKSVKSTGNCLRGQGRAREPLHLFDPWGTLAFIPAIICLLLALQWGGSQYPWGSARIIALFVVFSVLISIFGVQLWKQDRATIPPRILKKRSIWSSSANPGHPRRIDNLPMILSLVVGSILAGGVIAHVGSYTPFMLASFSMTAVGAGLISTLKMPFEIIFGLGAGLGMQQPMLTAQNVLKLEDVPIGTSIIIFSQTLGGTLFISIAENVFTNKLSSGLLAKVPSLSHAIILSAGATSLQTAIDPQFLGGVLEAYNDALIGAFYVSIAMAVPGREPLGWVAFTSASWTLVGNIMGIYLHSTYVYRWILERDVQARYICRNHAPLCRLVVRRPAFRAWEHHMAGGIPQDMDEDDKCARSRAGVAEAIRHRCERRNDAVREGYPENVQRIGTSGASTRDDFLDYIDEFEHMVVQEIDHLERRIIISAREDAADVTHDQDRQISAEGPGSGDDVSESRNGEHHVDNGLGPVEPPDKFQEVHAYQRFHRRLCRPHPREIGLNAGKMIQRAVGCGLGEALKGTYVSRRAMPQSKMELARVEGVGDSLFPPASGKFRKWFTVIYPVNCELSLSESSNYICFNVAANYRSF